MDGLDALGHIELSNSFDGEDQGIDDGLPFPDVDLVGMDFVLRAILGDDMD